MPPEDLGLQALDRHKGQVTLSHGSGGRAMVQLIEELFVSAFDTPALRLGNDHAVLAPPPGRLALSTDSFVVSPLFFPGGDIGSLAVHGTVNDVAMSGARPLYLSAGFILEEGLPLATLERVVNSMAKAAREAGVAVVAGDTKVVERGHGDGLFINTTGLGVIPEGLDIAGANARPGDRVLLNGTLGDHGIAVMAERHGLTLEQGAHSDSAALNGLVEAMVEAVPTIRVLRDPTRGGLAATLNEIARQSEVGMRLDEASIPVRPAVTGACELLGIDPLNVANEGKLVAICAAADVATLLAVMRRHPLGVESALIGEVIEDRRCFVQMETVLGGTRMVDWLAGEALPRIC